MRIIHPHNGMALYTSVDHLLVSLDRTLNTLRGKPPTTVGKYPASEVDSQEPDEGERRLSGQLMRVNHTGQLCAQVLCQGHLERLPKQDLRSRVVIQQMAEDEARHTTTALRAGGSRLPGTIIRLMSLSSQIMTGTAFWI